METSKTLDKDNDKKTKEYNVNICSVIVFQKKKKSYTQWSHLVMS